MRNKLILLIGVLMLVCLTGCQKHVKGSGVKQTDMRNVSSFNAIRLMGNYQVNVVSSNPQQQVSITSDDNLMPYILTKVEDKTLYISTKNGIVLEANQMPSVDITLPDLQEVEVMGGGAINVTNLKTDKFKLKISGIAKAALAGEVNLFDANISGAAQVVADPLIAKESDVKLSGSGNVSVYASKKLKVHVNGIGKVIYYGEPRDVDQKISGTGEVIGIPNNAQKNPA